MEGAHNAKRFELAGPSTRLQLQVTTAIAASSASLLAGSIWSHPSTVARLASQATAETIANNNKQTTLRGFLLGFSLRQLAAGQDLFWDLDGHQRILDAAWGIGHSMPKKLKASITISTIVLI